VTTPDALKAGLRPRGQSREVNYGGAREQLTRPAFVAPAIAANVQDDGLNKTERAYKRLLELRQQAGEIREFRTHALTFILGKDCRYTPEFFVVELDNTITIIEIKGFLRDDALVKFRTAQRQFPWFRWLMIQRKKSDWITIRE
jgi:hypothetical protein